MAAPLLLFCLFAAERLDQLERVGSAEIHGAALRLTPADRNKAGAAWLPEKQRIAAGFTSTFEFQITAPGGQGDGADGFAFVLQNSGPRAIAGLGGSGGFAVGHKDNGEQRKTAIARSIAVFFDTHRNEDGRDPSNNYIAICANGAVRQQMKWPPARLAVAPRLPFDLKDGKVHRALIEFTPPLMKITLDGEEVLNAPVDLATILDQDGTAWAGFTASTGAGYENHDIVSWTFAARTEVTSRLAFVNSDMLFATHGCLPDRNLCTPEKATVETLTPGHYRIMLPAHLEWGASIPGAGSVVIESPRGVVCWQASQCTSGATPGTVAAGAGFLVPDQPPGAVVMRAKDGRTWFSVNGRPGAFSRNEGYYELEVRSSGR